MRIHARVAACVAVLTVSAPTGADAGRQSLIEGPLRLGGMTVQSVKFHVPGDWMRNPRVSGRLDVTAGGGKDIEVLVLRASDFPGWEKREKVATLYTSGRATRIEVDVALPGPDSYVLVLSNRFSKVTRKQVSGALALVWDEDPTLPAGEALRGEVRFLAPRVGSGGMSVPVNDADSASVVILERIDGEPDSPLAATVRRRAGATTLIRNVGQYAGAVEEIGTVDVHADGDRDVFLVGTARDTDRVRRDLVVICPRQLAMVSLSLVSRPGGEGGGPEVRPGPTLADPRFGLEQSFLERIAGAYGAMRSGAGQESVRAGAGSIFDDWIRDNGRVSDGPLTIRRLPGTPPDLGPIEARLADPPLTYTAHAGSGVVAYDAATDEHYAVFHPRDRGAWATALAMSGRWLVVGTRGEGVALVDLRTFRLSRLRPGGAADTVRTIEVRNGTIRVNGRTDVPAPGD